MRMEPRRILLFLSLLLVFGCGGKPEKPKPKAITLCSGAGLIKPVNEIVSSFEKEKGIEVQVHYGGSAEIFGVLQTTCGCDVFIPGAYKYTKDAMDRGYIIKGTVRNLVLHVPVIIVPKGNPKGIKGLDDLARPGIRVVFGDPRATAIGKVGVKILERAGLWEKVKANILTFAPTVNQLLIYIATGQTDAAIAWEDMTSWAQARGKIEVVEIPKKRNIIKTIPTAVTVCAQKHGVLDAARSLNGFMAGPESLSSWERWGFRSCR